MIIPYSIIIWEVHVTTQGVAVTFLVSSSATRAAPAPTVGEGPTPPMLEAVGEKVVSQVGCGRPCGFSSHIFRKCWGSTAHLLPSGLGILVDRIAEVFQ